MNDLENLLIYAARYAHTRNTGAALQVVESILSRWPELSEQTKEQLIREAKNEATCNIDDWSRVINQEQKQKVEAWY